MPSRTDSNLLPRLAAPLRTLDRSSFSTPRDLQRAESVLGQAQQTLQNLMRDSFAPARSAPGFVGPATPAGAAQPVTVTGSAAPNAAINDNQTVTSTIHLDADAKLSSLKANLDLLHTYRGDLVVTLTSPSGKTATISDRQGGSADNLQGAFDLSTAFAGEQTKGDWTLTVKDTANADVGTLKSWSLEAVGSKEDTDPGTTVQPVEISTLEAKYGWSSGGWQDRLLKAADAASGAADGKVTVKELDGYLANPEDLQFLSSGAMQQARKDLAAAGGTQKVEQLGARWEQNLARKADGNHDGQLTTTELSSFLSTVKASNSTSAATLWMPDQKIAPFDSRIADFTKEADFLTPFGTPDNAQVLTQNYMRMAVDKDKRIPQWVSYTLTAADFAEKPAVPRKDNFRADPQMPNGPTPADYKNSGFDRGHMRAAADSVNAEAMDESFLMTNMQPQTAALNQRSWEMLEGATREVVQATGAKATIVTGGLFLDSQGNPLPPDQVRYTHGDKRVAVPTHCFKAVLLQMPDGTTKSYAYVLPNRSDLPNSEAQQAALLKQSRVSVDQVEKMLGEDLFRGLPPEVERAIEADPFPAIKFQNPGQWHDASLVWPQDQTTRA